MKEELYKKRIFTNEEFTKKLGIPVNEKITYITLRWFGKGVEITTQERDENEQENKS